MNDSETHDEYLRTAYQSSLEDIRFFKNQQWNVAYYALLLYGAVIALSSVRFALFFLIPILIGIFSIVLICLLEMSLRDARKRLNKAREQIPKYLHRVFFVDPTSKLVSTLHEWGVFSLLIIVLISGSVLSTLAALKKGEYLSIPVQLYLSKTTINSFGLILNIAGVFLLLFFWVPVQVALKGVLATGKDDFPECYRNKLDRKSILATLGFIFVAVGFVLQLVSNYV